MTQEYEIYANGVFWGTWRAETPQEAMQAAADQVGTDGNIEGLTAQIASQRRYDGMIYTRAEARAAAQSIGCKYRITREGEVHFFGQMPNSTTIGWWFAGWAK